MHEFWDAPPDEPPIECQLYASVNSALDIAIEMFSNNPVSKSGQVLVNSLKVAQKIAKELYDEDDLEV